MVPIPELVVADNKSYDSHKCKQFSKDWNFAFTIKSPN